MDASCWIVHSCHLLSLSPTKLHLQWPHQHPLPRVFGGSCRSSLCPSPSQPAVRLSSLSLSRPAGAFRVQLPAAHLAHSRPEGLPLSPSTRHRHLTDTPHLALHPRGEPCLPGGCRAGPPSRVPSSNPEGPHHGGLSTSPLPFPLQGALPALPGEQVWRPAHGAVSTTLKHHGCALGPALPTPQQDCGLLKLVLTAAPLNAWHGAWQHSSQFLSGYHGQALS